MREETEADGILGGLSAAFGCAYILDAILSGSAGPPYCGGPRRPGSSYCETHHALCHLRSGSRAEAKELRTIEALAYVVGGRQGRRAPQPASAWLSRVQKAARPF